MAAEMNDPMCFRCHTTLNLHTHHIFYGTANRTLSEKDKDVCTVLLCAGCHSRIHTPQTKADEEYAKWLKKYTQKRWMESRGKNKEDFIKRYGKNYL